MTNFPTAARRSASAALILAAALLAASPAAAQSVVRTVGAGAGCDFADLQAAIDFMAGQPGSVKELRLDSSAELTGSVEIRETSLTLAGGFTGCGASEPSGPPAVLRGVAGSVLEIRAGSGPRRDLRLVDLELTGGTAAGDLRGGGIEIQGNAGVLLERVRVVDNEALLGGGIFVNGAQGATLSLIDTVISGNRTVDGDGGGLRCLGGARVVARRGSIADNSAEGRFGGGMSVSDGCDVRVHGPFAIERNRARVGGGLDVTGHDTRVALLGASGGAVRLSQNRAESSASTDGGGALVDSGGTLIALDARIEDNRIIAAAGGNGGGVAVRRGSRARLARTLGDECHDPLRCATLSGNQAEDGAAYWVADEDSSVELVGVRIERNAGESVAHVRGRSSARSESVVMAHNEAANLVVLSDSSWLAGFVTVADNQLSGPVLRVSAPFFSSLVELYSSILFEPGSDLLDADPGSTFVLDCLLLNELATPPAGRLLFTGVPRFVDGTNSDYRLAADSDAIDVCDGSVFAPRAFDLGSRVRGADDPAVPDQAGRFDLGAHERGGRRGIFLDGFESGDALSWSRAEGTPPG